MASVVNSFAISGINGYHVRIETETIFGKPSVNIVGLGDLAVKEARERLEAAMIHSKFEFPKMKIVINLSPGDIKKSGSHFDLAMAVGLMIQSDQLECSNVENFGFIGELSLNGDLRPIKGILPMVMSAKKLGIKNMIVPKENHREACLVKEINIFSFCTLKEVVKYLSGEEKYNSNHQEDMITNDIKYNLLDFDEVQGQDELIDFIVVAASGGHNILMTGAPGCGKSMIAKRIPTILPSMTEEEALEVTKIYSVTGLLEKRESLITHRPFRAPHHNASMNSLIGGGSNALPGEISLAHNGVLFLDEIAEFNRKVLDSLRQPLEDGIVTISRVRSTHSYPADFMLVAAMNPCPCGYFGTSKCKCSDFEILKYREKISGPILDRIDIQKYVKPVDFMEISNNKKGRSSKELKEIIEKARIIQANRYKDIKGINCNAQMTTGMIAEFCVLEDESKRLLRKAFDKFNFSARTYHKFLKVARTFADIIGSEKIRKNDIAKALMCRDLEKEHTVMCKRV